MESDPIEDSPTKRRRVDGDSDDEYGAHPFDEEVATMLLPPCSPPAPEVTSPDFSSPVAPPHVTQPTQPLDTTPTSNRISHILVPATSPAWFLPASRPAISSSQPVARLPLAIAPPGTNFRPPVFQPSAFPSQNTQIKIVSDSEDDPLGRDPSDDELGRSADIQPTVFRAGQSQGEDSLGALRQQPFQQQVSQFQYQPSKYPPSIPRKRPYDDSVSAYANTRREPVRPGKQRAPARAQPVEVDIDPSEEIADYSVRVTVETLKEVFPQFTYRKIWDVFRAKRQNYNDALQHLSDLAEASNAPAIDLTISDDEIGIASVKRPAVQKSTVKRQLEQPTKSLVDKYSSLNRRKTDPDPDDDDEPVRPRGRLIRGRRLRTPTPEPQQSSPPREPSEPPAPITDELDEEAAAEADDLLLEKKLLKLINTCSELDFMDIANCSKQHAELILSHRPFTSLDNVRGVTEDENATALRKGRRAALRKPVGDRLVEVSKEVLKGLDAVDRLVGECQKLGQRIQKEMRTWGLKASQSTDELNLASLYDATSDISSKNDSGVGTPRSSPQPQPSAKDQSKSNLLQQPENMSPGLTLKDYQVVGLNWLHLLWSKGISGILADEMGLGKTCQVISFLSHLLKTGKRGPHLVVCPSSTLENWAREFQRFSPDLVFEVYHGSKQERDDLAQRLNDKMKKAEKENEPVSVNVIITTYDIARKTGPDHRFLRTRGFKTAIFDEGHMLKNSSTDRYRMLMNIPANWRLLMTGTPLQNNLQELVSVLAFIMPDMFSESKENLSYIFKYKAKTSEDDHAALFSKQRISRARSMMAPFILRRRKDQVLTDLPTKHTRIEYCDMTPAQKELYEEYAAEHQRVLAARAAGQKFDVNCNYLMLRRQAAVHPLLFRRHFDDGTVEKMAERVPKKGKYKGWSDIKTKEWFEWYSDFQLHQLCQQHRELARFEQLHGDEWMDSGKVQKLVEILKKHAASGARTLVFSQFTTVLDILEAVLATINITFSRIDGAVNVAERQDLIDQFSSDESIQVFMLSTKAGGTGINLACANKVVIFDSSFNPHDDIQAENRAHRIGQQREVEVIRLITKGTIEEQIHVLGNSKLLLDERVSGDENGDKVAKKAQELIEEMLLEKKEPEEIDEETTKGDLKDLFAKGLRNAGVEVFS